MNTNIPTCLALALALALAPAAAPAGELDERFSAPGGGLLQAPGASELDEEFSALEARLLQARLDGDAEALGELIGPGFEVYRAREKQSTRRIEAERWQKAVLDGYPLESFEIHQCLARRIGDGLVLTVTRATLNRFGASAAAEAEAGEGQRLLTGTWQRGEDGAWRIVALVSASFGAPVRRPEMDREAMRKRTGYGQGGETGSEAWRERMEEYRRQREAAAGEAAQDPSPPDGGG